MKIHLRKLSEECQQLLSRPPRIETRIEKVETIPRDYEKLKHDNEEY